MGRAREKWHRSGRVSQPPSIPELSIVVTGEPIAAARERHGGFAELIARAAGPVGFRFVSLDARQSLPSLRGFAGVVITGSAASVTERAPWMLETERRLAEAADADGALFGICFGHQLLGRALGGRVDRNPRGREIGSVTFERLGADPLFDQASPPFIVNMTHVDSIVELPPGARAVVRTERDPFAGVRFRDRVWGVQFHPEIDRQVMADYVEGRSELIASEGLDLGAIRATLAEGEAGRDVLRRFLAGVAAGGFER
jgi:GMP synthase (glutamine-hydrolysing)